MTFAFILAVMGFLGFMISGNPLPIMLIIIALQIAWTKFEDLKEKVEWLEIKLEESDNNVR